MSCKKYKIIHEQHLCIGCFACATAEPDYWEMKEIDGDHKSHVVNSEKIVQGESVEEHLELEKLSNNMEAAEVCPVNCIHIEENGKRVI
jgi:ferredoxin